jgi:hypothetical protein
MLQSPIRSTPGRMTLHEKRAFELFHTYLIRSSASFDRLLTV